jgi:hypothetical protein
MLILMGSSPVPCETRERIVFVGGAVFVGLRKDLTGSVTVPFQAPSIAFDNRKEAVLVCDDPPGGYKKALLM